MRADEHPENMRADYTFDFDPAAYTAEDHGMWRTLSNRQYPLLKNRACKEYLSSLEMLGMKESDVIPDWRRVSDMLEKTVNWRLVTVPGYLPPMVFLEHLSKRQFPVTWWIREPAKIDYLMEPDIFHDLFGHVPMLAHQVYADYMQEWGKGALKAHTLDADKEIERLYWFTVEFGLIQQEEGLRIYGSGIVSSKTESVYCLESDKPNRLKFDLKRIMRSDYRIDDLQKTYFVIDSLEDLFEATKPDFAPIYAEVKKQPLIADGALDPVDQIISKGKLSDA